MKVIIDFDNTFYTPNRDVDDGLALMYLLGSGQVDIVGITSTFGNSDINTVHKDTLKLMEDLKLDAVPYAKGAKAIGDYINDASILLAELVKESKGDISILATGSMTNLFGASLIYPHFFTQVKEIVIMGGITKPLVFAKQEMLELNLSVDPQASYGLLTQAPNLSIITGNNCLSLLFTRDQYEKEFGTHKSKVVDFIETYSDSWFDDNYEEYGIPGFYNWDTLAAAYLVHPEYFQDQMTNLAISIQGLSTGSLLAQDYDPSTYASSRPLKELQINLPIIKDKEALTKNIYQYWLNLTMK